MSKLQFRKSLPPAVMVRDEDTPGRTTRAIRMALISKSAQVAARKSEALAGLWDVVSDIASSPIVQNIASAAVGYKLTELQNKKAEAEKRLREANAAPVTAAMPKPAQTPTYEPPKAYALPKSVNMPLLIGSAGLLAVALFLRGRK